MVIPAHGDSHNPQKSGRDNICKLRTIKSNQPPSYAHSLHKCKRNIRCSAFFDMSCFGRGQSDVNQCNMCAGESSTSKLQIWTLRIWCFSGLGSVLRDRWSVVMRHALLSISFLSIKQCLGADRALSRGPESRAPKK